MVHLVLSSTKGNQGVRYFPYSGYLGLTPVKVEGIVRTELDSDSKPLQAKSITISIRCYESRLGRVRVSYSNVLVDHTQVLWSKPDDRDSAPIGNTEFPFRLIIPANVAGFSTATFVDYRCMWRVEAIIHHNPLSGIGTRQIKHFELPLLRYDLPYPLPTSKGHYLEHQTTKPRAPSIRYSVNAPTAPIGPMDLIPIPIFLLPADSAVSIRSASALIERRITLTDRTGPLSPPATPTTPTANSRSPSSSEASSSYQSYSPTASHQGLPHLHDHGSTSTSSLSSSNPTITPNTMFPSVTSISSETPLLSQANKLSLLTPSSEVSSKIVSNLITGVESSGQFLRDAQNVWSKTLTLQWPAAKSNSRWATGETMQSAFISVRFFVRVKIVVSSPTGTETIDLEEKELTIVSTNEPERQLALSKYNDMLYAKSSEAMRSKSKSPRRTKRDRDSALPSPAPSPPSRVDHTSSTPGSSSSKPKSSSSSRRPHTSAGPRDKAFNFAGVRMDNPAQPRPQAASVKPSPDSEDDSFRKRRANARSRPDTGNQTEAKSGGFAYFFSSPRIATTQSGGSATSTTASSSSISSSSHGGEESDEVKAWEEELARIEMRSRRSSDMLGFAGKRKRSAGAPRVVVAANPV